MKVLVFRTLGAFENLRGEMHFSDLAMELIASPPRMATFSEYALTPGRNGRRAPVDLLPESEMHLSLSARTDFAAKRLYFWDSQVAGSFWPAVALVEVLVRNAMNDELCDYFDVSHEDGWHTLVMDGEKSVSSAAEGNCLKGKYILLTHRDYLAFDQKLSEIRRKARSSTVSGDYFVAKVSLGMWLSLLNNGDSGPGRGYLNYEQTLWEPCLADAFPNYRGKRSQLRDELNQFAKLRNRIAHHEHLLGRRNLSKSGETLIRIAGYIDEEVAQVIKENSRFNSVIAQRQDFLDGLTVL